MSSRTYICYDCRTSKRAEAAYGLNTDFRCPICQAKMIELSRKWRIPKKGDDKEWNKLAIKTKTENTAWLSKRHEIGMKMLGEIDMKIENAKLRKDSSGKNYKLKQLSSQRAEIIRKYID